MRLHRILLTTTTLSVVACLSEPGPVTLDDFASVTFQYAAPTSTDPVVEAMYPACVAAVGVTHLHPEWRGFQALSLTAVGSSLWELTLSDVPVGRRLRIRVSDPNACALNPTGASTSGVTANGTPLADVVDTPGSGVEPGLAFTVNADGSIEP